MGGTGSGRWTYHDKKRTVEGCWALSISEVDRVLDFSKPGSISHLFRPTIPKTGKRMSPVWTKSKVGNDGKPLLGLSYTVKDRQVLSTGSRKSYAYRPPNRTSAGGAGGSPAPACSKVRSAGAGLASSTAHRGVEPSPVATAS